MLKPTARHQIVVAMTIVVNAVPKPVHAVVVRIARPKQDHRAGPVAKGAANADVVKEVAPVVVDQKAAPNRAVRAVKVHQKNDATPVQNVGNAVDQAEVALKPHPNQEALAEKPHQKVAEMLVQTVDAANAARKLNRMVPDADVPISVHVQTVPHIAMPDVPKHTAVEWVVVR